ncbi:MAG: hypothetical protein NZM04_10740 [Methylacidiphilales bacterium]|nr:hypothetical protein [Candidatus Methylacidiphilales bacterium]
MGAPFSENIPISNDKITSSSPKNSGKNIDSVKTKSPWAQPRAFSLKIYNLSAFRINS